MILSNERKAEEQVVSALKVSSLAKKLVSFIHMDVQSDQRFFESSAPLVRKTNDAGGCVNAILKDFSIKAEKPAVVPTETEIH